MKLVLAIASLVVAVHCLPADPDAVVPEALETPESELSTSVSCIPNYMTLQHLAGGKAKKIPCDGIHYYVTVPMKCSTSTKCGLIMDIHGFANTAALEESQDYLAKWGTDYINIRPEEVSMKRMAGLADWGGATQDWDDLHKLEAFLRQAAEKFGPILDKRKVHVAGFSQGGFLTWNLLCRASDLICSAAPLGMPSHGNFVGRAYNGHKVVASARGHANCFEDGTGPNIKRSIMYHQGKHDCFFHPSTFRKSVKDIKKLYDIKGKGKKQTTFKGVDWKRYSKGAINFQAALYDYETPFVYAPLGNLALKGHCFPSTLQPGQPSTMWPGAPKGPQSDVNCGIKDGYTWGAEVLKFFKANPCVDLHHESATNNDGKMLGNGCPEKIPHRYPHNNRCFEHGPPTGHWGGKSCNVSPKTDRLKAQQNDKKCLYAPRASYCNPTSNDGKKLANGCPAQMKYRYPHNNRCFSQKWGGKMCNVNPEADPIWFQKHDGKCCYA